jgi:hypothetical protein
MSARPERDLDTIQIHNGPSRHSPTIDTLGKGAEARQVLWKWIEATR